MNGPDLDPDLLRAFIAVADTRSFTRAAMSLNRTQSAVSMQVRRLEDRLRCTLFLRSKTSVEMTAAGEGLLGYARRILQLGNEAVGKMRDFRVEGRVRLGVMEDYGTTLVPPLLAKFVTAYPGVNVEMEVGLTCSMPERLGESFDVVLAMHPVGQGEGEFIRRETAVWTGSPTTDVSRFTTLPVALSVAGCLFRKWAIESLDAAGRPWRLAFVSQSQAAIEAIVAEGLAVSVTKAGTLSRRLRALSSQDGVPDLPDADIRLHKAVSINAAAALFADFLSEHLRTPT